MNLRIHLTNPRSRWRERCREISAGVARKESSDLLDSVDREIGNDAAAQVNARREFATDNYVDEEGPGRSLDHGLFARLAREGHDVTDADVLSVAIDAYWAEMENQFASKLNVEPTGVATP